MYYFADLDDTLYPFDSGLANATHQNIKGKRLCIILIGAFELAAEL